jgi:hypothetical protein
MTMKLKPFFSFGQVNRLSGIILITSMVCLTGLYAQDSPGTNAPDQWFSDIHLRIDSMVFTWKQDQITVQQKRKLAFEYQAEQPVIEVLFRTARAIDQLSLRSSGDYIIIDSVFKMSDGVFAAKLRLLDIHASNFISLKLLATHGGGQLRQYIEVPLYPYTSTFVKFYPSAEDLFIGEESVYELVTNNLTNVVADGVWKSAQGIGYRLVREGDKLLLYLSGRSVGRRTFEIPITLRRPVKDAEGQITHTILLNSNVFNIKQSPLAFLGLDQSDIIWDEEARRGIEVVIDFDRNLEMEKTYRLEAQEQPGGALIGEIFTRNRMSNGKVLCWLRLYNYHRKAEGYLYLKDGDQPKFLTNFNILPKTVLQSVRILREGKEYTSTLEVFPGEYFELRIDGTSLDRADIRIEDLSAFQKDTLLRSENSLNFKVKVPLDIGKTRLIIYLNGKPSGYTLKISEYQKARSLDFIMLSYDEGSQRKNATFNKVNSAIMYGGTLKDIIISPMAGRIDDEKQLYGKQFLTIKITLTNNQRQLVEVRTVENFVVCPDQSSPRFLFYQGKDCQNNSFNINSILSIKTNELPDWARVEIEIRHRADRHNDESYVHRVEFILARRYNFDIDVSFPAGLLQIRPGRASGDQLSSFGGVSLAALAQFNFFRPGRIAQYQPYRVGVGTIAMNAFDFSSDSADRGLALVALGSLSPNRRDSKLRLTLYFGGGYFLTNSDNVRSPPGWFLLIGPGIAVRI